MSHSVFISTFPLPHLISTPEVGDSYMGHLPVTQPGHGFSKYQVVYNDGSSPYALAQADAPGTVAWGVVGKVIDANTFDLVFGGIITGTHGLGSAGDALFLSQSVAGGTDSTVPSSGIVQQVALVHDADNIYVEISTAEWI